MVNSNADRARNRKRAFRTGRRFFIVVTSRINVRRTVSSPRFSSEGRTLIGLFGFESDGEPTVRRTLDCKTPETRTCSQDYLATSVEALYATGLSRGGSRLPLQGEDSFSRVPRACPIGIYTNLQPLPMALHLPRSQMFSAPSARGETL